MLRYVLRGATYIHIAASTLRVTMIWDSMLEKNHQWELEIAV